MFDTESIIFLLSTILVFCEAGFVDSLHKCEINDGDCTSKSVESVLRDIAKTGVPELGLPAIDPLELRNFNFLILDTLNMTLVEGKLKHIKDCKVTEMVTDVAKEHGFMKMSFKTLTLKGLYKATVPASNPLSQTFLDGKAVDVGGNFKVKIGNLYIRLDYDFYLQQRADDIYIKCKRDKYLYDYDIGTMTFFVDGMHVGTEDISPMVISLLNENWKSLMTSFGKPFMDKAMSVAYDYVHKFFDTVPCKYYISNDLTKYAKP